MSSIPPEAPAEILQSVVLSELPTIGISDILARKINDAKVELKKWMDIYKTDSIFTLALKLKNEDDAVVLPLIAKLDSYISISNFINSAPTDIYPEDDERVKITNATRSVVKDVEELLNHPELSTVFSWNNLEVLGQDLVKESLSFNVDAGQYEVALLTLVYLLHKDKDSQIKVKAVSDDDNCTGL